MSPPMHPVATHHLPAFVTAPGQTDVLLIVAACFVLATVIGVGVFYLKLHSLPEQLAHRGQKVQFQLVAVLGLLALFTHNHAFWVAGLLLALVPLPDFTSPLSSIATSLERIAGSIAPAPSSTDTLAPATTAAPTGHTPTPVTPETNTPETTTPEPATPAPTTPPGTTAGEPTAQPGGLKHV